MSKQNILQAKIIDSSTIVGIVFAFTLVILAMFLGGNPHGFIDTRAILIVIFGTIAITTACFSFSDVIQTIRSIPQTILYRTDKLDGITKNVIEISTISSKKGFLELEKYSHLTAHNHFLKDGIDMIVDHTKIEDIENILKNEIDALAYRHARSIAVLRKAGEISPAMGLIGTLIGLVQMLGNLNDTSSIGPAMAVALLTTFYGAILSYMIFLPLASKLERNTKNEILIAQIHIQAIKSIAKRESPRKLELILNSILPPGQQVHHLDQNTKQPK